LTRSKSIPHNSHVTTSALAVQRAPRDPAIDLAKGCAILGVILIHSNALHGNLFFRHVVNQAVPVFIVLFGVNSTFWWQRRIPREHWREWYASRVDRIMVPVWAMLPVWWALALYFRPFGVPLSWTLPFLHAGGYLLYVGAGWFVTLVIQLVLLQPILEALARWLGHAVLLAIGVVVTSAITAVSLRIVGLVGLFNYWILSPRFLAHVTFGMALAPYVRSLDWRSGLVAGAVLALAVAVQEAGASGVPSFEASWVGALALTVVLLVVLRPVARVPVVAPALEWLGQSSYGVYIGQLIVHNAFVYGFGLGALYVRVDPWLYTALLLAGGVLFTWLGEALRARATALRTSLV
jgi:peptidoglycan/LPS O-acetylase OafA/YrhL